MSGTYPMIALLCILSALTSLGHGTPLGPPFGGFPARGGGPPPFVRQKVARGYSGSDSETFDGKVIEEHDDYKVVSYPASKWICTQEEVSLDKDDILDNWQEKFSSGIEAMAAKKANRKKTDKDSMWKKLYRYIQGVNREFQSIDMTSPVTKKYTYVEGKSDVMNAEMCFWSGSEWADKELPEPVDEAVYFQEREPMTVFVRRFGGWALTIDDWSKERHMLELSLAGRSDVDLKSAFYTAGYQSPWKREDRRNEVWLPMTKSAEKALESDEKKTEWTSVDDDLETVPYTVVESNEKYELREYPAQRWICTSMEGVDPKADPMNGWEERFNNDAYAAMSAVDFNEQVTSKMFMKLFKYISGVNKDFKEIEMTTPVTIKHVPSANDLEDMTQCFWMGTPYQQTTPPSPIDKDVFVQERQTLKVYVRKFGGFAMSMDDFEQHYVALKSDLESNSVATIDDGSYYHLSYNSPWTKAEARRNEIWIEAVQQPKERALVL